MYDFLIVGAGFSGAVLAERLASQMGKKVLLVEKRAHIGGNAFDCFDANGIMIHKYGPHIFHTNSEEVFKYLSQFTEWRLYEHLVLANSNNVLYNIPINKLTINKYFNINIESENEARTYIENLQIKKKNIQNSEDYILSLFGEELSNIFFKGYTKKQWGMEPIKLSTSVCGRLPLRYNNDCRYFTDKFQFMPINGFTRLFDCMLSHKNINILLDTDYRTIISDTKFNKLIFSGPIDEFFDYQYGKLPYRSLTFNFEHHQEERYQPVAVVNYVDEDVPFTRITEYKYLTGQSVDSTTISKEYSSWDGEPFYPVPSEDNLMLYNEYKELSKNYNTIHFCGRLANYKYFNMDQAVASALTLFKKLC